MRPAEELGPTADPGPRVGVSALGAELAAEVLAGRLVGPGSSGVQELLLYLAMAGQGSGQGDGTSCGQGHGRGAERGVCAAGAEERAAGQGQGQGEEGGEGTSLAAEAQRWRLLHRVLLLPPPPQQKPAPSPGPHGMADTTCSSSCPEVASLLVSLPDRAAGLRLQGCRGSSSSISSRGNGRAGRRQAREDTAASAAALDALEAGTWHWHVLCAVLEALEDPVAAVQRAVEGAAGRWTELRGVLEPGPAVQAAGQVVKPRPGQGAAQQGRDAVAMVESHREERREEGTGGQKEEGEAEALAELAGSGVGWEGTLVEGVRRAAVELLFELLLRLCRRGHAATAADALLAHCAPPPLAHVYDMPSYDNSAAAATGLGDAGQGFGGRGSGSGEEGREGRREVVRAGVQEALLLLAEASPPAVERLLAALLDRAGVAVMAAAALGVAARAEADAATGTAAVASAGSANITSMAAPSSSGTAAACAGDDAGSTSAAGSVLDTNWPGLPPPLPHASAALAAAAVASLLPPALATHPAVSCVLTDTLLLSLKRSLPHTSLQLLTHLLPLLYPHTQPTAATSALAKVWADPSTVTRASVQHQAFMGQALLLLLRQLDRGAVEGTPGLLGCLVGGVSTRLGSPLLPTHRQAMRVGRAFSLLLDPASDLFADCGGMGHTVEELWPGACERGG